ncbi:MAG: VCBS repeat-containing protein, partial [Candidatus Diapherotrites archaeon]|nr:VCBS repeat-containing protein [Candidatus Diapherotrites archaeon]
STQTGNGSEVTSQFFVDGWHQRNNTFLTQWVNPVYLMLPTNEVGDAIEVTPQVLETGWHQKNNTFFSEFNDIEETTSDLIEPKMDYLYNVIWDIQGGCQTGVERHFKIYFDDHDDGIMFWPTGFLQISTVFDEFFLVSTHDYGDVTMFRSNAEGGFTTEYIGRMGARGWGLAIADFNEDDLMDFVSGADLGSTTGIYFHQQGSDGSFETKVQIGTITGDWGAMDMSVADFDGNSHQDFIVSGNNTALYIFKGDGTGSFTMESITHSISASGFRGKDAADVDNDNDVDFMMSANMSGSVLGAGNHYIWLFRNDGNANFSIEQMFVGAVSNTVDAYHLTLADYNEDGFIDVTVKAGHSNTGTPMKISFGDGTGTFSSFQNVKSNGVDVPNYNYMPADSTDFNHDGHQDIVFTSYDGEHAYFMPGNGNGAFDAFIDLGAVSRYGNSRALIMGIAASGQKAQTDYSIVISDPVEFTGGFKVTLTECG